MAYLIYCYNNPQVLLVYIIKFLSYVFYIFNLLSVFCCFGIVGAKCRVVSFRPWLYKDIITIIDPFMYVVILLSIFYFL